MLFRSLRAVTSTPIIFLTARTDEVDQLVGFAAGGDDYVTKPFSPKVVLARISSLLRRNARADAELRTRFQVGPLMLDTASRDVTLNGVPLDLTRTEFDLLALLMETPNHVLTRDQLLQQVWGDWYGDSHVVEVHMSRLRNKVKKAGGPTVGVAVRGVGYRLGLSEDA